jgi:hypothetical protein
MYVADGDSSTLAVLVCSGCWLFQCSAVKNRVAEPFFEDLSLILGQRVDEDDRACVLCQATLGFLASLACA